MQIARMKKMQEVFEKIIEKLKKELKLADEEKLRCARENPLQFDSAKGYAHGVGNAIEIVKQEAEQHNNGWIPCSERLPTTEEYQRGNGRFLVTDGNRTYEAEFDIYESHTFGKSRMATEWFITDKCVTHWQNEPLPPQPYQPKGE